MTKFTIDELYHRVFKDCPGEPFPYTSGSVVEKYELCVCDIGKATYPHSCRDFETADTLTIVCPEVPSGIVMVAVTGNDWDMNGSHLVRFPDNTYYYFSKDMNLYRREDGYILAGRQYLQLDPVSSLPLRIAAEDIENILTESDLWWHHGGMPGSYEVELFNKVDSGEFSDIGSLKEVQEEYLAPSMAGKTRTEIRFVLHPDIIVPNDGKD
jgi:hypothetical protein